MLTCSCRCFRGVLWAGPGLGPLLAHSANTNTQHTHVQSLGGQSRPPGTHVPLREIIDPIACPLQLGHDLSQEPVTDLSLLKIPCGPRLSLCRVI